MMRRTFLDPGALRHELSLQSVQSVGDGAGGFADSWTEIAIVFARVEPVSQRSLFRAAQRLEEATHDITIRFRADVVSGMRFEKHGRTFEILTVADPDETGRYLVCTTKKDAR